MESGSASSASLGSWEDGDFRRTVTIHGGVGADAGLPEHNRFVTGVAKLVLQRVAQAEKHEQMDEPDLAIFVLSPSPPPGTEATAKRVPMLDNGLTPVVGRLWFTTAAVTSAHYVDLPPGDDDAHFSYVDKELGLGSERVVIFDPRATATCLRYYPEGLGKPETVECIPLVGEVTQEDVFKAMDRLYEECFVTPMGLPQPVNLWENAQRHWPRKDAEALIQSHLRAGLLMRFAYCSVRPEQTQTSGRTDLEIEQFNPLDRSSVTYHGILELKVLRTFRHSGTRVSPAETKNAIADGVGQAGSYRADKGSRWSALCCYDMRQHNEGDGACFAHVRGAADTMSVALKRWFLYPSPAEFRKASTP